MWSSSGRRYRYGSTLDKGAFISSPMNQAIGSPCAGSVARRMDPATFYRESRVVLVAGKGGVGKTTVAATLAIGAARGGHDVLIFSLGDPSGIPALFGLDTPLTSEEQVMISFGAGRVRARLLLPDAILLDYLNDHGFGRVARRLGSAGAIDVIASAIPGIREVLVVGKLKQLERADAAQIFIVDAPASGHTIRFLTSASGLSDAARSGPLRTQADAASALLADPDRTQLLLVTIPEETPVNETVETAFAVEDQAGIRLGPIVVNGCIPVLDHLDADPTTAAAAAGVHLDPVDAARVAAAASFRRSRQELQDHQLGRLAAQLPLDQVRLPQLFLPELDDQALLTLADAFEESLRTVTS